MNTYIAKSPSEVMPKYLAQYARLFEHAWVIKSAEDSLPASARAVMKAKDLEDVADTLARRWPADHKVRYVRFPDVNSIMTFKTAYTWADELTPEALAPNKGAELHVTTLQCAPLGDVNNPLDPSKVHGAPPGWMIVSVDSLNARCSSSDSAQGEGLTLHTLCYDCGRYSRALKTSARRAGKRDRTLARKNMVMASMKKRSKTGSLSTDNWCIASWLRQFTWAHRLRLSYMQLASSAYRIQRQSTAWRSVSGGLTTLYEILLLWQAEVERMRAELKIVRGLATRAAAIGHYRNDGRRSRITGSSSNLTMAIEALDFAVKDPACVLDVASYGSVSLGRSTPQDIAQARSILQQARACAKQLRKQVRIHGEAYNALLDKAAACNKGKSC